MGGTSWREREYDFLVQYSYKADITNDMMQHL